MPRFRTHNDANGGVLKTSGRSPLSLQEDTFFQRLESAVLLRLESLVYQRDYEARQIIYFPDDHCDQVYWVRRGRVRITRISDDGRELSFRHLTPGDFFGEECLIDRPKREDYAEAMAPTTLLLMRADDFVRSFDEEPGLSRAVAEGLCRRSLDIEQVLAETVFHSVRSRVAAGLLRLCRKENRHSPISLPVTHQEIANLIGSTRETTTATLHALRKDGLVALANRRLTVLDPIALEREAKNG